MTHPYARLDVSPEAYAEISRAFIAAGYGHAFQTEGNVREIINMNGIALAAKPAASRPTPSLVTLVLCQSPGWERKGAIYWDGQLIHSVTDKDERAFSSANLVEA